MRERQPASGVRIQLHEAVVPRHEQPAARGPVVDTDALVRHVALGRIRAVLDVTDPEPLPPGHPLWTLPGVLISPHVGGNTSAFLPRARTLVAEQLRRFSSGDPLVSVVSR